ncbi:hypothetical protein ACHWQZ_G014786 [Mnemiopsis leidyi]
MSKRCLLLLTLICVNSEDFYFYVDVRWDDVDHYKSRPELLPHNHGLRTVPALHVALDKVKLLQVWSASPRVEGLFTENVFYRSSSEYLANCRSVDGSPGDWSSPCFVHANYDIGFCSPTPIEPTDGTVSTLHCKNKPLQDHIFSFKENQTDPSSLHMSLLPADSQVHLVLPDGTGLSTQHKHKYNEMFGDVVSPETLSLKQLTERVQFISRLVGPQLAGIIGSSENAYYTALVSKKMGIPNIVTSVTDTQGLWPIKSGSNFESGILDNTLVLGYEDWMIMDLLTFIQVETEWYRGTLQILHESGDSERLARCIHSNLEEELEKRLGDQDIRACRDMYLDRLTTWDYYIPETERNSPEHVDLLLETVSSRTRVIFLLGKEEFIRNMLKKLHEHGMYKRDTLVSEEEDEEITKQFGIVVLPENGAPCGDILTPYSEPSSEPDSVISEVLRGAYLLCHNAHNRASWVYRSPSSMSGDGSNSAGKYRWKLDPPSLNTWTRYQENVGAESYTRNREYLTRDLQLNMTFWNLFENDFREKSRSVFDMDYPENQSVSGIAGFTHDSLIWGMFTAVLNRTHPKLFLSKSGDFTLVNLYSDGSLHPDTLVSPSADLNSVGWPGMFGIDSPPTSVYNKTYMMKTSSFLINDGPWHDIINRYTFKDNRPFGSVPHTIKIFEDNKWKALVGMLPHRRKEERDTDNYERSATLLSSELHTDSFGNNLESGAPFFDKYKFIRYCWSSESHVNAKEPQCGYNYYICNSRNRRKCLIMVSSSCLAAFVLLFTPLLYITLRWTKYYSEVNAMEWRLKDSLASFRYQWMTETQHDEDISTTCLSIESHSLDKKGATCYNILPQLNKVSDKGAPSYNILPQLNKVSDKGAPSYNILPQLNKVSDKGATCYNILPQLNKESLISTHTESFGVARDKRKSTVFENHHRRRTGFMWNERQHVGTLLKETGDKKDEELGTSEEFTTSQFLSVFGDRQNIGNKIYTNEVRRTSNLHAAFSGNFSKDRSTQFEVDSFTYSTIAHYGEKDWAAKELLTPASNLLKGNSWALRVEMKQLLDLRQKNVTKLCGVVYNIDRNSFYLLSQHCKRGSLQDLLEEREFTLDAEVKLSFICDIIKGMSYLHSEIGSHGYLKSSNVLLTGCFTVKISDFGTLSRVSDADKIDRLSEVSADLHLLWTAPEILRLAPADRSIFGSKEGDVYSFGVICHEILECSGPFNTHDHQGRDPQDVISLVKEHPLQRPYRPAYSVNPARSHKESVALDLSVQCWSENSADRPTFRHLHRHSFPKITSLRKSVIEHILETVKKYSKKKEKQLHKLESELRKVRAERSSIQRYHVPWEVLENVISGGQPGFENLPDSSILSLQITGAEELLKTISHTRVWNALQQIREEIFSLVRYHPGLYCTVATESVYVILANGTNQSRINIAATLHKLFRELVNFVRDMDIPASSLRVRAGMDSGEVYTGLVTSQVLFYQLFGPVCTISHLLRDNALPGSLLVSENTKTLIKSKANKFKETASFRYKSSVLH